jgi:taurine-pyruvate aminotransferase
MNKVISGCKTRGLIIGKNGNPVAGFNNVLTIAHPLCLTEDDFTFLVKNLKEAIAEI